MIAPGYVVIKIPVKCNMGFSGYESKIKKDGRTYCETHGSIVLEHL